MLPSLARLKLTCATCVPCGVARDQPPFVPEPPRLAEVTCPICMNGLSQKAVWEVQGMETPDDAKLKKLEVLRLCDHQFHRICLAKWVSNGNETCPSCRLPIYPDEVDSMVAFIGPHYTPTANNADSESSEDVESLEDFESSDDEASVEDEGMYMGDYDIGFIETRQGSKAGGEIRYHTGHTNVTFVAMYYTGAHGDKRLVQTHRQLMHEGEVSMGNVVQTYQGESGQEHLTKEVWNFGVYEYHYEGERGAEYRTYALFSESGYEHFYDGERGHEQVVRSLLDGELVYQAPRAEM